MMMDKLKRFWNYSAERATKTFAQTALATMSVGAVGIMDIDWLNVLSVASLSLVMSLLTSVLQYDRAPVDE
jgi:hypothetical protein